MSLSNSFQEKIEREKVMKMKVVESSMVRPFSATPTTRLWISNLDAMSLKTHYILTLYFFRRPTGAANFFGAAVLKVALSRALVEFYPVAGRLELKNDCIDINCNGEGALFVEAEADGNMDDLGDFVAPPPDVSLVPSVSRSEEISSHLVFMTQVTRFKCGGVCLGIGIEHHVSDGHSSLHFINTWSNLARGLDTIAVPPFFDRTILRARDPPQPKFPHIEYLPPPQLLKTSQQINSSDHSSSPRKIFTTFKLTRSHLNALKAKCKQDDEQQGVTNYTTYEVLAAHLWCCISTARGLSGNQETMMYIPVDGRSRLQPSLPSGYYGNVVFKAATVALASELMRSGLRFAVGKIRQALVRMDDEYLRSALDHLEVNGSVKGQVRATKLGSPNLGIVSWARLPLYDADFGWGKAAYVGLASTPPDGKVFVLPSPPNENDEGGLMCAMTIPEEEIPLLEKLLYDI